MPDTVIPKFVPRIGGLGFVLNPARTYEGKTRFYATWPAMFAPAEGVLDRIMREHFARTMR